MGRNSLMGSLLVGTFAMGAVACAGSVADDAKGTAIVGEEAELVAQKKQWLANYDEDCNVCFQAFELCKVGAEGDAATEDACQVALDSCVRGGLIDQGDGDTDGGVVDEDPEVDAGAEGDGDGDGEADVDGGVDGEEDGDNGRDGDVGDGDVGGDGSNNGDGDGEVDGDGDVGADGNDGDGNDGGDDVKGELEDEIRACLDEVRTCLDGDASAKQCVRDLKGCVREALSGAFTSVCDGQRRRCDERNVSEDVRNSVENLCEEGLPESNDGPNGG